jgi:redox-sensitive bicupin YhaK (pirin superfamily)
VPLNTIRQIKTIKQGIQTYDGAGVKLTRIFGFLEEGEYDPFLLLDHFGSDNPNDYSAGFPWHPHRGMETVTYMLDGNAEHGDSMGNKGVIGKGDIQWMTAGSGIIHQEMPKPGDSNKMYGFQLWVNLPKSHKMIHPRYQDIKASEIPIVNDENGVCVRVLAGVYKGKQGPVKDIIADPIYFDITIPPKTDYFFDVKDGHTAFALVFEGECIFGNDSKDIIRTDNCVLFSDGNCIAVKTATKSVRFILVSGKPIKENIAWHGPIVMNTREELDIAFREYNQGTFIKH